VPVSGCYQVLTTTDSEAGAARIAEALVTEGLAACVQVAGPVSSVYRWRGGVERAREWQCTAKTSEAALDTVIARIRSLHSYEQPEIIATAISTGDPAYLEWVRRESSPSSGVSS
jgi:periplasmic divalent cation tolerance protein